MQSTHFKRVATILLRKSNNKDYTNSKSYKLIVLLNTLNKTLKSIISERIRYVVETHATLSNIQMKVKKQRFVNTTLQLITKKIHTIYNNSKKKVIFIKFECVKRVRQRLAYAITAQYAKKKSVHFVVELSKRLFEKATNDIDDKWIHVARATNKSKHIVKFFFIFYIVFLLQRRFVEELWRH